MRLQQGFTLVEVMLYAAINSVLILGMCTVSVLLHQRMIAQRLLRQQVVYNHLIITLLQRDLMQAEHRVAGWDKEWLVFAVKTLNNKFQPIMTWVGWECRPQGVARIAGDYDVVSRRWLIKKKTDLFACSITSLNHTRYSGYEGTIKGVRIVYRTRERADNAYEHVIALRNRLVM